RNLLAAGRWVEVLGPPEVRARIASTARAIGAPYGPALASPPRHIGRRRQKGPTNGLTRLALAVRLDGAVEFQQVHGRQLQIHQKSLRCAPRSVYSCAHSAAV